MISWSQFSNRVHRILLEAFSQPGTEPESIARHLINRLPTRPSLKAEREALREFPEERRITQFVHFTPIENVPTILKFGLIPRVHLEATAIRVALNPRFSDDARLEGSPQANCLSLSFPNFRMFYAKRQAKQGAWAVLGIDPHAVIDLYCEFFPTNAARSGSLAAPGVSGARRLFSGLDIRIKLALRPQDTTDPQAEALEDTVIPGRFVRNIYVETENARAWLEFKQITSAVEPEYFSPRQDYSYWTNHPPFFGKDDYLKVRAYENPH